MSELTPRQAEILEFIQEFAEEEGCPPTRAEIAEAFGFRSANAAEDILDSHAAELSVHLIDGVLAGMARRNRGAQR